MSDDLLLFLLAGFKFWKIGSRKIFAISQDGKQRISHKRTIISESDSDEDFEPVKKRRTDDTTSQLGVVRLYRTFSNYISTGETRFARCFGPCSRWFKRIEPPPTFSNHINAELTCVAFSTVPNLLYLHLHRRNKVCRVLIH